MNPEFIIKFINSISEAVIVIILMGTGWMYALWLKPFLENEKLAALSGIIYCVIVLFIYVIPPEVSNFIVFCIAGMCALPVTYYFERKNFLQKIFLCAVFVAVRYAAMFVTVEINNYLSDFSNSSELIRSNIHLLVAEFVIQQLLYIVISLSMLYLAIRLFHRVFIRKNENMEWKEIGILLAPGIPIVLTRHVRMQYYDLWNKGILDGTITENIHGNIVWLIFYVVAYLVILIVIYFYQDNKNRTEEMKEMLIIKSQQMDLQAHIEQVEKIYEEQRGLRHDIGNHIQIMEQLIASEQIDDAANYLERLKKEWKEISPAIKTGNPVIDVIFEDKTRQAKEKNIKFVSDFHYPENTSVNAYDLSIILNNAINNCIENANGEEPYFSVSSFRKKSVFMITIKNSYHGKLVFDKDNDLPKTTKAGEGHGIGLKNIRRIAKTYMGDVTLEQTEDEVILTIMLQVEL